MSSDSEDDCYGNAAQQLQRLKNQHLEDKIGTIELLDEIMKNNTIPAEKKRKFASIKNKDTSSASVSDLPEVVPNISVQNSTKRTTRSPTRSNTCELPLIVSPPKRRRNVNTTQNTTINTSTVSASRPTAPRGRRGRGGTARTRSRRLQLPATPRCRHDNNISDSTPIYSVGSTGEYRDQSDNQVLFSSNPTKADVIIVDDEEVDDLVENEEFNVKVYWTSSEYHKFTIRRFQKISLIFDYFAQMENVGHDKLLFRLNGKILQPNDTPDSIGYTIAKIIDGGIVEGGISDLIKKRDTDGRERVTGGIKLKFQSQTLKKPFELFIKPDDRFSLTMVKVAEYMEMPLERLKLEFDGHSISGKSTAKELELEGGECIDVKIVS